MLTYSLTYAYQGSIFSTIGRGIESIISAIANVIITIVGAITTVRFQFLSYDFSTYTFLQGHCHYIRRYYRHSMLQMQKFRSTQYSQTWQRLKGKEHIVLSAGLRTFIARIFM